MMDEHTPLISSDATARPSGSGPSVAAKTVPDSQGTVNCSVCGFLVSLANREKQIVVKCPQCMEATPIKAAPVGKQYIRCPCNCLLICSSSATRVACPRQGCKRVIDVSSGDPFDTSSAPVVLRVRCSCGNPFTINPGNRTSDRCRGLVYFLSGGTSTGTAGLIAATCPHCNKLTSIGPAYARVRMVVYGLLALIFLITAITVTATTAQEANEKKGLYFLWAVLYICIVAFAVKFCCFFFMPIGYVEVPGFRL